MIKPEKYSRKTFEIEAVQVTNENLYEVAQWCGGEVQFTPAEPGTKIEEYVKVRVHRPLNERQTRAFVGDWVLFAGKGYKVYTQKAFESCFEPTSEAADPNQLSLVP